MYQNTGPIGAAATAAALPFTGLEVVWVAIAAFTLISAGVALVRILPSPRR